jgi:methyl-accepting chemotaxis protein
LDRPSSSPGASRGQSGRSPIGWAGSSQGDLSIDTPFTGRGDEVGDLARSLGVFKENALKMEADAQGPGRSGTQSRGQERRAALLGMADDLERSVAKLVGVLADSAGNMKSRRPP